MAPVDVYTPLVEEEISHQVPENSKRSSVAPVPEDDDVHGTYFTSDGSVDAYGNRSVKSNSGGWKACPFILGNEFCERLAFYGINFNLVVYLTTVMNQGNAAAAGSVTAWSGTCYITTFIGAFLADSCWGRYWTIGILSCVYALGMFLLTLSASLPALKPPVCSLNSSTTCEGASALQMTVFYTALYLIALGTGGIKPCVSTFGADQFDTGDPAERTHMGSFFNWFYFSINVGALIASSVIVYVQENIGWGVGFGIPALAMLIAICTFFIGTPLYRYQKPGGSPFTRIAQVLFASAVKWKVKAPADEQLLYEASEKESGVQGSRRIAHSTNLTCLDKAATQTPSEVETHSPWRLCTVTQVEEVKILIRMLPIWASTIVYFTVYSQMPLFVEQGLRMDGRVFRGFKIPAASLIAFNTLSIIICVPLYDRFLVPFVRKITGLEQGFTQVQRMGIGLVLATFSMVVASVVEVRRLELAAEYHLRDNLTDPVPMSILWQIPQYFMIGASEIFTAIGQLEFFYDQAPDAMRSLSSALALSTIALGSYLSSFLVFVVAEVTASSGASGWIPDNLNRGHLDYFFFLIALLSVLNGLFFWFCSRGYRYKQGSVS